MFGRGTRSRWAVAGAAAIHVALLVGLQTGALKRLFNDSWNRPGPAGDFFAVYHAGRQVRTGRDPFVKKESPPVTPPFAPYRYVPGVAQTLGVAVTTVRPWPAFAIWVVLQELLLIAALVLLRRLFSNRRLADWVTVYWLLFTPYLLELWMGQFTFFTASLVLLAAIAWRAGRGRSGALAWGAAAAIKLFPLALVPMLIRRGRLLYVALGLGLVGASMVWFVGNPAAWAKFARLNFSAVDIGSFHSGNFGFQAFAYELAASIARPTRAEWALFARIWTIGLLAIAAATMVRKRADDRVSVAVALMLLPLVSKHAWEHHYVVALPALTLLAAAWSRDPRRLTVLAVVAALIALPSPFALLHSGPPVFDPEPGWSATARLFYHGVKPLALLAAFAAAVDFQLRRRSDDPPALLPPSKPARST